MRYLFKTDYRQDMTLWRHRGDLFWYGLLVVVLLLIPRMLGEFYIGELGGVFIFAIAGVGLMLLAIILICIFPGIATLLPDLVMGTGTTR